MQMEQQRPLIFKKSHHKEMHATRQWQETGNVNISTLMFNKWLRPMCTLCSRLIKKIQKQVFEDESSWKLIST